VFSRVQEEDFEEDEGIYDDLNLDEEEEKFGLAPDDGDSDDSDEASDGMQVLLNNRRSLMLS
jgi:CCR4-NOT transcriptional regulation complex NOT5 subunit